VCGDVVDIVHACDLLTSGSETAALWANLFRSRGAELYFPFLDSRILRLVLSFPAALRFQEADTKAILKQVLIDRGHSELACRPKLSFVQPVAEWMKPEGQLAEWVDDIRCYDFLDAEQLRRAKSRPNWFLYNLLCYHIWYRTFVERSLPFHSE
jgi:asparagine synthetase B (glutamine-hydrolysing)